MLHLSSRGDGQDATYLLHGFLGTGRNLASLARRLSEASGDRVALLDLRGHGNSPPLGEAASLRTLGADVVETLRADGAREAVALVGHSLGGRVALAALDLAPELFRRVVLLDIAPGPLPTLHGAMQRTFERLMGAPAQAASRAEMRQFFLDGNISAAMADWVLTNLETQPDGSFCWHIDRPSLARLHYAETDEDLWPVVAAQANKIQLIYGTQSTFVSAADRQRLLELGAQVTPLEGASHFVHVDALDALVQLLTQAL